MELDNKKIESLFVKYLYKNKIYDNFISALKDAHSTRYGDIRNILQNEPSEAINHSLLWDDTEEGWVFWAIASIGWRKICLHCNLTKHFPAWEIEDYRLQMSNEKHIKWPHYCINYKEKPKKFYWN